MDSAPLILSWSNPVELFTASIRSADLYRTLGNMPAVLVKSDITWGVVEDTENSNPFALYRIIYRGVHDEEILTVQDEDIRRFPKPDSICEIYSKFTYPDGSPAGGQCFEFSDELSSTGQFVRRIVSNSQGEMSFFAMPDSQFLVRIDGWRSAYEVVIPDQRRIDITDLLANYGTEVDLDPRRSIGLVQ